MTTLADWIGYGRKDRENISKRTVRGWLAAARGHVPVIDRISPEYRVC